jgi:hypothetical protein
VSRAKAQRAGAARNDRQPSHRLVRALGSGAICAGILGLGATLRSYDLGRLSCWYDEVVTMRLARAGNLRVLVDRLFQIDATRAPLHPILLHAWLKVFGTSEASARSLSVVCGVATLVLIFLVGRIVFDVPTGLWAAWLGALSPILVVYAREARMYAWLVLITCFGWLALLVLNRLARFRDGEPGALEGRRASRGAFRPITQAAHQEGEPPGAPVCEAAGTELRPPGLMQEAARSEPRPPKVWEGEPICSIFWTAAYGFSLIMLAYSHPLGLVMAATLALAGLIGARACFRGMLGWVLVHGGALLFILPWAGHYFDHPPEFLSGRPPLRFLLGVPIGFVGGDFRVLLGLVLLVVVGLMRRPRLSGAGFEERGAPRGWMGPVFLLLWLALPPTLLYLYSLIAYPIFGPARYTAFVAPAFLILVAAGLRQLPALLRYPAAVLLALVSAVALGPLAYDPELKADWRDFGRAVSQALHERPGGRALVIVASADPARNVEVETARYYLPESCTVLAADDARPERLDVGDAEQVYFAVGLRHGEPVATVPKQLGGYRLDKQERYPGLAVFRGTR